MTWNWLFVTNSIQLIFLLNHSSYYLNKDTIVNFTYIEKNNVNKL